MLTHPTLDQLRALKLDGMVQAFIELEAQEEARNLAHACRWIAEHRGLLITGPCGVGKSWLSCALAQKACRDGYTVHYARVPRLFADLDLAHGDGRFARLFRLLVKVDLLVLDDWGPDRLSASQRRDLMEIVEDRHGRGSTLITTASRDLVARCHRRAHSRRRDLGSHCPQRLPARARRPVDAQAQSRRSNRTVDAARGDHRSRWQADQGGQEMSRTSRPPPWVNRDFPPVDYGDGLHRA